MNIFPRSVTIHHGVSVSAPGAWFNLGKSETTRQVSALQNTLDSAAASLVETLASASAAGSEAVIQQQEKVRLEVRQLEDAGDLISQADEWSR